MLVKSKITEQAQVFFFPSTKDVTGYMGNGVVEKDA